MLIKNFVPRYHCSQLSIRPCPFEFLIANIYIYYIYVDQSSFDDEKLGSRSNYAHVCQQFRDTPHDQRHASYSLLNKKLGLERFFPRSLPLLIAFHSTDKEAGLNIKVILFLPFVLLVALTLPRERNFRLDISSNNNSNNCNQIDFE